MSAGTKRKETNRSNDVNSSDLGIDSLPKRYRLSVEDWKEWGLDSVVDYLREHEISSEVLNAFHGKFCLLALLQPQQTSLNNPSTRGTLYGR